MRPLFAPLCCLIVLILIAPSSARADVRDQAHVFDKDAVAKANGLIADIRRAHHVMVVVETTAVLPEPFRSKSISWFTKRAPHMDRYARDMVAKAEPAVDGLYVLIYQNPKERGEIYLWALVYPEEAHRAAFTDANCVSLRQEFTKHAKESGLDKALLDLVTQARADLVANTVPQPPEAFGWVSIAWLIGGGLLLLAFLLLLSAYLRKRVSAPPGPANGPTDSPEATPALLGNMLGGQAAHWVTDPAFRSSTAPARGQEPPIEDAGASRPDSGK